MFNGFHVSTDKFFLLGIYVLVVQRNVKFPPDKSPFKYLACKSHFL